MPGEPGELLVEEVVVLLPPGCQDSGLLVVMTLMVGVVVNWPATPFLQSIRLLLSSLFSSAADPVPSGSKPRLWIHFNDIARSGSVPVSNYIIVLFFKAAFYKFTYNVHYKKFFWREKSCMKAGLPEPDFAWSRKCKEWAAPATLYKSHMNATRTGIGTWWVW